MIILAFPGLGKTTLAKSQGGFIDLDFDFYRKAGGKLGISRKVQLQQYAELALHYADEGYSVLLNEPAVLRMCLPSMVDVMFLPDGRLLPHCARKLAVDEATAWQYRMDWHTIAIRYGIPVHFTSAFLGPYQRKCAQLKGEYPFIPKRVDETRERSRKKRE